MIGRKLKQLRKAAGLSQAKLAAKADLSPDYIYRLENNRVTNIGLSSLQKVARVLNAHVSLELISNNKAA